MVKVCDFIMVFCSLQINQNKMNMDFYDFIFEGLCKKTKACSSDSSALRKYFISKALEFEYEIQRDNFFDDLDNVLIDIEKKIYINLNRDKSELMLINALDCSEGAKEFYREQLDNLWKNEYLLSSVGFNATGHINVKQVLLIRKAFQEAENYFKIK